MYREVVTIVVNLVYVLLTFRYISNIEVQYIHFKIKKNYNYLHKM